MHEDLVTERGLEPDGLEENYWFSRVKKAKPGAMVLAVHEIERNLHGPYPLMVASTNCPPAVRIALSWWLSASPVWCGLVSVLW